MNLEQLKNRNSQELRIELEGLSGDELKTKLTHNLNVERIEAAIAGQLARLDSAFRDCATLKLSQITKRRDELQQQLLELLQERALVAKARLVLLDSFEGYFQKALDAAEAELETAKKKAVKQLHTAGISAESNPIYHQNSGAAQTQFDGHVQKSQFVRAAKAALQVAEDQMARLNTLRIQSDIPIGRTVDDLRAFVHQLLR